MAKEDVITTRCWCIHEEKHKLPILMKKEYVEEADVTVEVWCRGDRKEK